jgi:rubredoxin
MICPECGAETNHHADKLMYSNNGEEVEEFHTCPQCGTAGSRQAEEQLN